MGDSATSSRDGVSTGGVPAEAVVPAVVGVGAASVALAVGAGWLWELPRGGGRCLLCLQVTSSPPLWPPSSPATVLWWTTACSQLMQCRSTPDWRVHSECNVAAPLSAGGWRWTRRTRRGHPHPPLLALREWRVEISKLGRRQRAAALPPPPAVLSSPLPPPPPLMRASPGRHTAQFNTLGRLS